MEKKYSVGQKITYSDQYLRARTTGTITAVCESYVEILRTYDGLPYVVYEYEILDNDCK
jgi:hypothetical protein